MKSNINYNCFSNMKKFFLIFAMAASAMSMSAQEGYYGNKFWDNWYLGLEAGVSSKTTHQAVLKHLNPEFGVRVGKWITPAFGLALEGQYAFSSKARLNDYRNLDDYANGALTANLLGQFNLNNIFGGYKGEPRNFEVIANVGIGYQHTFAKDGQVLQIGTVRNSMNQKIAVDFTWNFGGMKQWQFYVEPALNYLIAGSKPGRELEPGVGSQEVGYDINYSYLQLHVGLNYKFKTTNKTHNFAIVTACDMDAINAEINALRGKDAVIAALQKEIEDLKKALEDCQNRPVEKVIEPTLPSVFYPLDKSVITPAQAQNVAIAAEIMKNHPEIKLQVKGYASPEGPADHNNDLSVRRAQAVKDLLISKYGIDASRITTEGCGVTDKLFEIYEFNRVAMLYIEK